MKEQTLILVVLSAMAVAPLMMFLWDWWTLQGIPDPRKGDIWRSQHSGKAIRIDSVGLTDGGSLTWDYTIETAPGEFNCIAMTGYGRRDWRLMVREQKRVLQWRAHVPPRPLPVPARCPAMPPVQPAKSD